MKKYQDKEILSEAYGRLGSCKKVAQELGCNEKTIHAWAKKLGVKLGERYKDSNKKHYYNEDYFKNIDNEKTAYWLGFIYADGCVYKGSSKNSYRLQINLKVSDKDMLDMFQKEIGSDYEIQEKVVKGSLCALLKINSTKMCMDLMDKGVLPRKSLTLTPPTFLREDLIRHFIRGYFDGDGSFKITPKDGFYSFSLAGTKSVLEWIKEQLIPICPEMIDNKVSKGSKKKIYTLETAGRSKVLLIGDYLYEDASIMLNRKYDRFLTHRLKSSLVEETDKLE